jgi:hypothetical protein
MTAFGDFCPKSSLEKSQFSIPTSEKSEKVRALLLCHF